MAPPKDGGMQALAAMFSHVPDKGKQQVRYYGFYSNVARGKRKKRDSDEFIYSILEPEEPSTEYKRNWARLIQKIYEVDPLTCPKCSGKMKIISVIEDSEIVKKILKHLDLWNVKARPPPRLEKSSLMSETIIDYSDSQLLPSDDYLFYDPDYPVEDYAS